MKPVYIENPVSTHKKLLHITFTKQKKCCAYPQIPLSAQGIFCVNQCLPFTTTFWLAKIILCTPEIFCVDTGYFCISLCDKFYFSSNTVTFYIYNSMLLGFDLIVI